MSHLPKFWILDAENRPVECGLEEWGRFFERSDRIVGYTEIASVRVSTVFLGIDHRILGNGPPILFETLVFGGALDGEGQRYSSWDDAATGHQVLVKRVRAAIGQSLTRTEDTSC